MVRVAEVELPAEIIMVEEGGANIKKPWCENRVFSRIQDLLNVYVRTRKVVDYA